MFHALIWIPVLCLLAAWSFGGWAVHALATWAVSNAGSVTAASIGNLSLPSWLASWVPADGVQAANALIAALAPSVEALMSHAPATAPWITAGVWALWALGAGVLLVAGVLLSMLLRWAQRRAGSGGATSAAARPVTSLNP
jgi:hypothetical protein